MQAGNLQYTSATFPYKFLESIFSQIIIRGDCFAEISFPLLIYKRFAVQIVNLFHF